MRARSQRLRQAEGRHPSREAEGTQERLRSAHRLRLSNKVRAVRLLSSSRPPVVLADPCRTLGTWRRWPEELHRPVEDLTQHPYPPETRQSTSARLRHRRLRCWRPRDVRVRARWREHRLRNSRLRRHWTRATPDVANRWPLGWRALSAMREQPLPRARGARSVGRLMIGDEVARRRQRALLAARMAARLFPYISVIAARSAGVSGCVLLGPRASIESPA